LPCICSRPILSSTAPGARKIERKDDSANKAGERERIMKRMLSLVLSALFLSGVTLGEDAIFNKIKVADPTGKQVDANLVFSDANKNVVVRVANRDFVLVPYDQVDRFSYEYTKKHRITQGAIVMVASLGAGAIVMLTKSKSHWLYIDFHEQGAAKSVVLRMDKNDYKKILDAVKTHTGKDVQMLQDEKGKKIDTRAAEKPADKPISSSNAGEPAKP
jgi:hypothetical protein